MTLYHFTCRDGLEAITREGVIRPHVSPQVGRPLVWLTNLDVPNRLALGLTSHTLGCDRMEYRFEVDDHLAIHWPAFFRSLPFADRRRAVALHYGYGVRPAHWFVSEQPIRLDGAA